MHILRLYIHNLTVSAGPSAISKRHQTLMEKVGILMKLKSQSKSYFFLLKLFEMKMCLVSSSAAMNLEKLKLFRHYYVMVRFIVSSMSGSLVSNHFFL